MSVTVQELATSWDVEVAYDDLGNAVCPWCDGDGRVFDWYAYRPHYGICQHCAGDGGFEAYIGVTFEIPRQELFLRWRYGSAWQRRVEAKGIGDYWTYGEAN